MDFIKVTEDKWNRLYEKYGARKRQPKRRLPEKNRKTGGKLKWILIIIAIAVMGVVLFYIFGLPQLDSKPNIENPRADRGAEAYSKFIEEGTVTIEDVAYLSNEIGSYKLKSHIISGEKPEIELVVEDTNQTFDIVIENKMPIVILGMLKILI